MRRYPIAVAVFAAFWVASSSCALAASDKWHVTGPKTLDRLTIYFVHGSDATSAAPLVLREAMAQGLLRISAAPDKDGIKSGITLENLGDRELFLQSGQTLKTEASYRMIVDTLVLPPHSTAVPVRSYCIGFSQDQANWPCPRIDYREFFKQAPIMTRATRIEIQALGAEAESQLPLYFFTFISAGLADSGPDRRTDAQHRKLFDRLEPLGHQAPDIIGCVLAIDGAIAAADVYAEHALFLKMWPALLGYGVGETSIANKKKAPIPSAAAVERFLAAPLTQEATSRDILPGQVERLRHNDDAWLVETERSDGSWIARSFLGRSWNSR